MSLHKNFKDLYSDLCDSLTTDWRRRDKLEQALKSLPSASKSYATNAIGDICQGDNVLYIERQWSKRQIDRYGRTGNCIIGYNIIYASVERESFGLKKGQHTFSLRLKNGDLHLIKDRNIFAVGVWRKQWDDENRRLNIAKENEKRANHEKEKKLIKARERLESLEISIKQ